MVLAAACGGGESRGVDGGASGGDEPFCAMADAGALGSDWIVTCPDGEAEVCGDARWECDTADEGWVLTGDSPSCNLRGELACVSGEPRCVPLPDC